MTEGAYLESLIAEYSALIGKNVSPKTLARTLAKSADWTATGAEELMRLVNNYGSFMLRNALALAVALGKEDGKLGF